ncbi:MAG: VWA domain-containing protein [Gammaproteobacteria bacterium]
MPSSDKTLQKSSSREVTDFLAQVANLPARKPGQSQGRLIFAMDATASREPSWERACELQSDMFTETMALGGLAVQLCHYGGHANFGASDWLQSATALRDRMHLVRCASGLTQVERVLRHAAGQARQAKVHALVFVGDRLEEPLHVTAQAAGELGLLGVPAFLFQEGDDSYAERGFRDIARLTRGVYCRFDASSANQLRELLSAVAVYAAGGRRALADLAKRRGGTILMLSHQLGGSDRS